MKRKAADNSLILPMLGVLVEGPAHPYRLHLEIGKRTATFLDPVSRATLYNLITVLKEKGWVSAGTQSRSGNRPEKTTYSLTPAGFAELIRRLTEEIQKPSAGEARFVEAVSHLGALGPQAAAEALRERKRRLDEQVKECNLLLLSAHDAGSPRLFVLEGEFVLHQKRSERQWVHEMIGEIESGSLAWPRVVGTGKVGRRSKRTTVESK